MQYVCDAGQQKTWFRIETEAEACVESETMKHAVEKYFRRERAAAERLYQPNSGHAIERDIGLKSHTARTMPLFLTLRAHDGTPLATAMLPPGGKENDFRMIIVGPANADPYSAHGEAIKALAKHYSLLLPRERCFPYQSYGM